MDIELLEMAKRDCEVAEKGLRGKCVGLEYDPEEIFCDENSFFHPANIFYIRKHYARRIFKVYVVIPGRVGVPNGERYVNEYKVKFETAEELLRLLKSDFVKAASGLIVSLDRIIELDRESEKIKISRSLPFDKLEEYRFSQVKSLPSSKRYLIDITDKLKTRFAKLPKNTGFDGFCPDYLNKYPVINPMDICHMKKTNGAFHIRLSDDINSKRPRRIVWISKKSMKETVSYFKSENYLIQVSRNEVINIYSLMIAPIFKNDEILLQIRDSYDNIPVKVGKTFQKEIRSLILNLKNQF